MASRLKRSLSRAASRPVDTAVAALAGPLEAARKRGATSTLLLVDINNFHVISNGLGRAYGDDLLGLVAKRLELSVQNHGQVLSCGGDRFLVQVSQPASGPQVDATSLAARLINAIRMPMRIEGDDGPPLVVSASIGSVVDDGASADELLRCAEIALHEAKVRGMHNHVRFEPAMRVAAEAQARLERDLREALDTERLFLVYLPSIDIATNRVTGAEALLRWQHPDRGVVLAREFVPLLEKSGTIIDIGSWVLQEACMQAAAWQRREIGVAIRVNLSLSQIRADVLLGDLQDALETSHLDPSLLVLEIAESTIVEDTAAIAQRLQEFKALGVRISVDNFGAAYATLGQLQRLPLDSVTIDRTLIADLGKQDTGTAMVRTLVEIASGLGLETVAEGVEDELQLEELRLAGCSGALGYLFSEPVDAEALDKLFENSELTTPAGRSARARAKLHDTTAAGEKQ
jgi:diguanylate cyclase (GGDEF)-like protein